MQPENKKNRRLPISKEVKDKLETAAANLSFTIKTYMGEGDLWYKANSVWRDIDEIPVEEEEDDNPGE